MIFFIKYIEKELLKDCDFKWLFALLRIVGGLPVRVWARLRRPWIIWRSNRRNCRKVRRFGGKAWKLCCSGRKEDDSGRGEQGEGRQVILRNNCLGGHDYADECGSPSCEWFCWLFPASSVVRMFADLLNHQRHNWTWLWSEGNGCSHR